jgi:hypothetical protein
MTVACMTALHGIRVGMIMVQNKFRMGRLDHIHIRVPNRAIAARWYEEHLGFEPVERFSFWAAEVDGVSFIQFARSLPNGLRSPSGDSLQSCDIVDFDLCWV